MDFSTEIILNRFKITFFPFIYFKENILVCICHGKKLIQMKFIIVPNRFRHPFLLSGWQPQGGQQHFQPQEIRPHSNWVCMLSKVLAPFKLSSKSVSHHAKAIYLGFPHLGKFGLLSPWRTSRTDGGSGLSLSVRHWERQVPFGCELRILITVALTGLIPGGRAHSTCHSCSSHFLRAAG